MTTTKTKECSPYKLQNILLNNNVNTIEQASVLIHSATVPAYNFFRKPNHKDRVVYYFLTAPSRQKNSQFSNKQRFGQDGLVTFVFHLYHFLSWVPLMKFLS